MSADRHVLVPMDLTPAASDDDLVRRGDVFAAVQIAIEHVDEGRTMNALHRTIACVPAVPDAEGFVADAYYRAIHACLDRYHPMAVAAERRDLCEFIDQCYDEIGNRAPLYKLNRWLGYIQGVLIEIGCTDVISERDWSRAHFRPLDFPAATITALTERLAAAEALAEHHKIMRASAEADVAALKADVERVHSDRQYIIGFNDGWEEAINQNLKFPTMLRKMWSGGEVQGWIDAQMNAARAARNTEEGSGDGR